MIELEVRRVRMPLREAALGMALLCERGRPDAEVLRVPLGASEAEALLCEVRQGQTRSGRLARVIGRAAAGLGRAIVVRLGPAARTSERAMEPAGGIVEVPMPAGDALTAAGQLNVPVLADPRLFSTRDGLESPRVAAFLEAHPRAVPR